MESKIKSLLELCGDNTDLLEDTKKLIDELRIHETSYDITTLLEILEKFIKAKILQKHWNNGNTTFRNEPIEFTRKDKESIKITENALNTAEPDIDKKIIKNNLISYMGNDYSKEQFYKAMFKDYKKFPYKVQFKNDDVFYLSGSQRAKLQYNILAYHFGLVEVDEQDKNDLTHFAYRSCYDKDFANYWLMRMFWDKGHEKMVSFGASLGVVSYKDGDETIYSNNKGIYCYRVEESNDSTKYTGVARTWKDWQQGIISFIDSKIYALALRNKPKLKENDHDCLKSIYYQNGLYLTLPMSKSADNPKEGNILFSLVNFYIRHGTAKFELSGEIPNAEKSFTIDYNLDVEIVRQHDNTKQNQELGRKRVIDTFSRLTGDIWTTQEIISQGFNRGNIERFVKYGLIKRIKRGNYERIIGD